MNRKAIDITYTRSMPTMKRYITTMQERRRKGINYDLHADTLSNAVTTFKHWYIAENEFPYDAIADINHMILPLRKFTFDWRLMTKEERDELDVLKTGYLNDHYDVVYENLPQGQTILNCFHLHLLKLKRKVHTHE